MFSIRRHRVFFSFLLLFFSVYSYPQGKVVIKANVDKNKIVIGEQVHLRFQADFPPHEPMRFFTVDSIAHFEILERKKIDTIDNSEGIKLSQSLTLTSFDSGHWVIPAFELAGDKPMFTDSIPIDVGFSPFDPNQDYHDIKDIIEVHPVKKKKQNWYWYTAASIVLVAAIIYLLARKKQKPASKIKLVDPFTEAKLELDKLTKEKPSGKLFYTRLVDIFRLYIFRRKGIASLQETTEDLVLRLRSLKLPDAEFNQLAEALRLSDFVKFAKYETTENDRATSFQTIKSTIEKVEQMETKTERQKQS